MEEAASHADAAVIGYAVAFKGRMRASPSGVSNASPCQTVLTLTA
jgi:hypothetical protein